MYAYKKIISLALISSLSFASQNFDNPPIPQEIRQMIAEGIEIPREQVIEFRDIVTTIYHSACNDNSLKGCEEFEEFINAIDSFILNGSISAFQLINPATNALITLAMHLKTQIAQEELGNIQFRIQNFNDAEIELPDEDIEESEN